ncbi:MAG: VOC family protein [Gammaproteobacteria bacterium]|nr:VOC family protein [Gammaproteobacteria bacterium]
MELNHTIVPSKDKVKAAEFFAEIMGLTYEGSVGHFAPVVVNDALTMDFDNADSFQSHHYAFKVSDDEFDGIFERIQAKEIVYGSGPFSTENGEINRRNGGRGFYWRDVDGHLLEVLTRD